MKFKRVVLIVLALCMAFSLAACKKSGNSKEVVKDFMDALTEYDVDSMAEYLEDVPTADETYVYDVFTDAHYVDLYRAAYKDNFDYSIESAKAESVKVKVTMPDLVSLYDSCFNELMKASAEENIFDGLDNDSEAHLRVIAYMRNEIEENGVDTVTKEFTLKLDNINGLKIMNNAELEQLMTSYLCDVRPVPETSAE